MSERGDRLLYALTWWGFAEWSRFVAAFDELFRGTIDFDDESVHYARQNAALTLDSLGHCEVHFGRSGVRVSVAPAVLAGLPLPGLPRAVLCGARASTTLSDVVRTARGFGRDLTVDASSAPDSVAPTRVECHADSTEVLRRFAQELGVPYLDYPPAMAVASASGSLLEHLRGRLWGEVPELNWTRWDFDPRLAHFVRAAGVRIEPRLTRYEGGFLGRRYFLWHYGEAAETNPFWGRYAIFSLTNTRVLSYDEAAMAARVPRDAPLPRLLARALALSSGTPARHIEAAFPGLATTRFQEYAGVSPEVFNVVAAKLQQPAYAPDPRRLR